MNLALLFHDVVQGGSGKDTLIGDSSGVADEFHGDDYLDGEDGADKLYGYGGDDTLLGGTGDDILEGDASTVAQANHGDDWLDGEEGNDKLQGDGGSDTLIGGAGNDQLFGDADDIAIALISRTAGDDMLFDCIGNDMKCRRWADGISIAKTGIAKVGAGATANNDGTWRRAA